MAERWTKIRGSQIRADSVQPSDLQSTNSASDTLIPAYDLATTKFTWAERAKIDLSNLASVAINTSLISDTDSTDDLGSSSIQWANLYVDRVICSTVTDLTIENDGLDKDIIFKINDGGVDTGVMRIDGDTGYVKIDNATAAYVPAGNCLHIQGSGGTIPSQIRLGVTDSGQYYDIGRDYTDGYCAFYGAQASPYSGFKWYTQGTQKVTIDSDGKVGIGTATPAEILDVNGNINSTGVIKIDDVQVISNRVIDDRCDDAINSGDATTDGVIDALRDAMIAHGLIAAA